MHRLHIQCMSRENISNSINDALGFFYERVDPEKGTICIPRSRN